MKGVEKIFFIVPNLNAKELLKKVLSSIFKAVEKAKVKAEVIVVDNGSTDGSRKWKYLT